MSVVATDEQREDILSAPSPTPTWWSCRRARRCPLRPPSLDRRSGSCSSAASSIRATRTSRASSREQVMPRCGSSGPMRGSGSSAGSPCRGASACRRARRRERLAGGPRRDADRRAHRDRPHAPRTDLQHKAVEAMAQRRPVISTAYGAEALASGVLPLIADEPQEIAASVTSLLADDELWRRLSDAGTGTCARPLLAGGCHSAPAGAPRRSAVPVALNEGLRRPSSSSNPR